MSQLIDRLNQVTKATVRSMGFGSQKTVSPKPRIQLIASVSQADTGSVSGADALVLRVSDPDSGARELKKVCKAVGDVPCGGWLSNEAVKEVKSVAEAGIDFIVFPANTPLVILKGNEEKVGRILEVEASLNIGLVRAISELPVDAILLASAAEGGGRLTWNHLMLFKYFASVVDKHLLVAVPSSVSAEELKSLWEVGVNGVVIEANTKQQAKDLADLRQAVDGISFTPRQKQVVARVSLPYPAAEEEVEEEEEEGE